MNNTALTFPILLLPPANQYQIFQGLAPAFIGSFSDAEGRRPAYLICFIIYIAANIGLALQSDYAALLILRCVQSSGSSGTIALANAVVADIATSSERGTWMGWASCGTLLGPTLGPIIGGLLSQYLGWRSIFWFLTIFAGVYLIPLLLFFPESCRAVVGNGAQRPSRWNTCLLDPRLKRRVAENPALAGETIQPHRLRFPNPLKTLKLLFEKEAGLILLSFGLMFAGYYALLAALPSQLQSTYGFDPVHVGLCFIAAGLGGSLASVTTGRLMDWNFHRHAKKRGITTTPGRRMRDIENFPIEAARLELVLPLLGLGAATILAFGWVMHYHTNLSGPLVLLFFTTYAISGASTVMSTLTVDLFPEKPATATAAGNMTRCWLGAGASAIVVPMIESIGTGWTFTFVAGLWVLLVPALMAIMRWGPGMRKAKDMKLREKKETREAEAADVEKGRREGDVEKEGVGGNEGGNGENGEAEKETRG